jgi:hypothetical protein
MDPTATWNYILEHFKNANKQEPCDHGKFIADDCRRCDAVEHAIENMHDLIEWLENGGFPPQV